MLYKVRVFYAEKEPQPWDSMEGVNAIEAQTGDIKPPPMDVSADDMQAALASRLHLGRILSPSKTSREYAYIAHDGVGLIHAAQGTEDTITANFAELLWVTLRHREWRKVGRLYLRAEQIYDPAATWWDTLKSLPRWKRVLHWVLRRRCKNCLYFDQKGAQEWRTQITHEFAGISNGPDAPMAEAMWNDVTKIEAAVHRAPDFQSGEFGYCPRRDCGLSGKLLACGEYKRA